MGQPEFLECEQDVFIQEYKYTLNSLMTSPSNIGLHYFSFAKIQDSAILKANFFFLRIFLWRKIPSMTFTLIFWLRRWFKFPCFLRSYINLLWFPSGLHTIHDSTRPALRIKVYLSIKLVWSIRSLRVRSL